MSGIEPRHLRVVEKWTFVLAAIVVAVAWLAAAGPVATACTVGAGLMCANAVAIRLLTERVFRSRGGASPGIGVLLFNAKMALLIALVWIAIGVFHVDGVGLLIGISVFPVAIVGAALSVRLAPGDPSSPTSATPPMSPSPPSPGAR